MSLTIGFYTQVLLFVIGSETPPTDVASGCSMYFLLFEVVGAALVIISAGVRTCRLFSDDGLFGSSSRSTSLSGLSFAAVSILKCSLTNPKLSFAVRSGVTLSLGASCEHCVTAINLVLV